MEEIRIGIPAIGGQKYTRTPEGKCPRARHHCINVIYVSTMGKVMRALNVTDAVIDGGEIHKGMKKPRCPQGNGIWCPQSSGTQVAIGFSQGTTETTNTRLRDRCQKGSETTRRVTCR